MTNNSTPRGSLQGEKLRRLEPWQLAALLRREGITQWDVAEAAGVSQGTVAKAIHRRGTGPAVGKVWTALEKLLT